MPKREDINTVLVIGSGPIVIGQACEFDYSGTQACKALRSLGYKVDLEMNDKKVKKCLEFANKEKIPYVIILGDDEVKNNYFNLKNMLTGEQISINNLKDICKYIKKNG